MGLLDGGLQSVFGAAFGGIYLDGKLHVKTLTEQGDGDFDESSGALNMKYQKDELSDTFRTGDGIPDEQVKVLILQASVSQTPTKDDEIEISDGTYTVVDVKSDPANTHWVVRGNPAAVDS